MKVKVLKAFNDKEANKRRTVGEVFEVSKERYKQINSTSHGQLVEEIRPAGDYPKHTGGGWYELSNGEKVQGQGEAVEAQKKLTE